MSHEVPTRPPSPRQGHQHAQRGHTAALTPLPPCSTALPCAGSSVWHRCLCTSALCYTRPGLGEPLPFGSGVDFCICQPSPGRLRPQEGPGRGCCWSGAQRCRATTLGLTSLGLTRLGLIPAGSPLSCWLTSMQEPLRQQPCLCSPLSSSSTHGATAPASARLLHIQHRQCGVSAPPLLSSTWMLIPPCPKGE